VNGELGKQIGFPNGSPFKTALPTLPQNRMLISSTISPNCKLGFGFCEPRDATTWDVSSVVGWRGFGSVIEGGGSGTGLSLSIPIHE